MIQMTNGLFKKAAARVTQDMEALMVIPMAQDVYLDEMVKSSWWDRGNPCKYYGVTPEEAALRLLQHHKHQLPDE